MGLHNRTKIYHHHNMNMRNIHIAGNCLKHNMLYSIYHLFTLYMTLYLANQKKSYCLRLQPPMETLVAEVNHQ